MSKFFGKIGFGLTEQVETSPGVWEVVPVEKEFKGDISVFNIKVQNSQNLNDDIVPTHRISIVADAFAQENFYEMKYVIWRGVKWKVTGVDDTNPPRLNITLGGRYVD